MTNAGSGNNMVYAPVETVEEMQVQVGGYDAEVSGANSGVVKEDLKGHRYVYWFCKTSK